MIAWWVVLAAFVVGVGAAALVAEFGWLLQRAENGRGRGPTGDMPAAAPPYDWSEERDL